MIGGNTDGGNKGGSCAAGSPLAVFAVILQKLRPGLVGILGWAALVNAQPVPVLPVSAESSPEPSPELSIPPSQGSASAPVPWQRYMDSAGVSVVLKQANTLIEQEVRNLEKVPLGFTPNQLQVIRDQLRQRLGEASLKRDIIARLERDFSSQQRQELERILASTSLQQLLDLQQQLDQARVRQAVRSYRVKLQERSPSERRLELLSTLDQELQQSALETDLKVELRKQLLATVSHLKTSETFSEELLESQLSAYRDMVEGETSDNALLAYLYLLKRTPSSSVRDLLVTLDQPAFEAFMALCREALQESFRESREQIPEMARLAGN